MTDTKTKSQQTNADLTALLRARCTLFWVITREEARVENALIEAAATAGYETQLWDCATGLSGTDGQVIDSTLADPQAMLRRIGERKARGAYILRDMHAWMDGATRRMIRSLARQLQSAPRDEARAIIILTPIAEVPPELAGHAMVIDYPLPERAEVAQILDSVIASLPPELAAKAAPNGTRDAAIEAAVGLTAEEAANCYAKSLVTSRKIDPAQIASEKKRVIAREKVLTWYDPDPRGMDAVGGLEQLKAWLTSRRTAFSPKARAYGLPPAKGVFLVGLPGTGKSLTAKCIATAWGMPLLRLDLGALRSKYVGESEGNIRKALAVAETVAPCVVWVDEIEKALAGSTGSQGDGGVSADALGTLLSWMQEKTAPVFVVATANDVTGLPPELMRKGRFDELFFLDLPTLVERKAIVLAALKQYGRENDAVDADAVARATEGYVGAEIAAIVPDAMFAAFADGERGVSTDDLTTAAATVVPLAKMAADRITKLREWAVGRARPASTPEVTTGDRSRKLDLG